MKLLHLLRHAKSDWTDTDLSDHQRPLSKRGVSATKAMGEALAAEAFQVDAVFCSTARRAKDTIARIGRHLRKMPTSYHDGLYMAPPEDLLSFIHDAPESAQSVMLVGHNPATHDLALTLIGRAGPGCRKALAQLRVKYPTGALCSIKFNVKQWRDIAPGGGTLTRFLRPRDLEPATPDAAVTPMPPRRRSGS